MAGVIIRSVLDTHKMVIHLVGMGAWFPFMLWVTKGIFDAPIFLVLAALAALSLFFWA